MFNSEIIYVKNVTNMYITLDVAIFGFLVIKVGYWIDHAVHVGFLPNYQM
jgi:hypothetical protein